MPHDRASFLVALAPTAICLSLFLSSSLPPPSLSLSRSRGGVRIDYEKIGERKRRWPLLRDVKSELACFGISQRTRLTPGWIETQRGKNSIAKVSPLASIVKVSMSRGLIVLLCCAAPFAGAQLPAPHRSKGPRKLCRSVPVASTWSFA